MSCTPSVSDHALLCLKSAEGTMRKIKNQFKFLNSSADLDGFLYAVANSWHEQISGRPMYMLWKKLQRLQPILKEISKPLSDVKLQISKARENLLKAQLDLGLDRMNADKIEVVKQCNDDLLNWQEIEEKILKQKSKLESLKLGDGNNSYFHASIKTRSASKNMNVLYTKDGTQLTTQDDIEEEVMSFYSKLTGMADNDLNGVDITVMREGPQLNNEQREKLTGPITDKEITDALQSIGDLKSPSIDGYGAYFFKKAWNIVKPDVLGAVHDFFDNGRLYKAANCTLVTLIPKTNEAKKIKEGDKGSITLMLEVFDKFSKSTGLKVNPSKCCIFFGGVDQSSKDDIKRITHFEEGKLPFRYLVIPMTSKKLSIQNYMGLIDKIVGRITHWSSKLLSYAGRIQLLNSVIFSMTNYWLQCLPLPKAVIQKINSICRTFFWTGSIEKSRKAPIAWKTICQPKRNGGLNLIDLEVWNRITLLKLIWNLSGKSDSLWVKWVHTYYIKNQQIMEACILDNASWIMKAIMQHRDGIHQNLVWIEMLNASKISMKKMYMTVHDRAQSVVWRTLFYGNVARPRALINL
ncbi:unnamed protein product [Trifolium pratense]|uniref:Uncharacterized protein n=1 Tax=Trifolium pratense TaxID=57577 RepID=A0ACB0LJ11_TRIPR|nr:unnamed protein product [Trifolium pratense]